jgi:hypothetical protein
MVNPVSSRWLLASACCVCLLAAGCSGGADSRAGGGGPKPSSPATPSDGNSSQTNVTSCQDLLDRGWDPPDGEPQLDYDPTTGLATVHLVKRDLTLDIRHDQACRSLPFYGPIFRRTLRGAGQLGG